MARMPGKLMGVVLVPMHTYEYRVRWSVGASPSGRAAGCMLCGRAGAECKNLLKLTCLPPSTARTSVCGRAGAFSRKLQSSFVLFWWRAPHHSLLTTFPDFPNVASVPDGPTGSDPKSRVPEFLVVKGLRLAPICTM